MLNEILFALVFFLSYVVQAISGFAGNIFAMPPGIHLLGLHNAIAAMNVLCIIAAGLVVVSNIRHVNWRELAKMVLGMLPFLVLGIWLDSVLSLDIILKVYAIAVLFVGFRNLLVKKRRNYPVWLLAVFIACAGLIQGMFVSGGAFLVIYAVQKLYEKQEFRATLSMVWVILNIVYAVVSFANGYYTGEVLRVIAMCIPLAFLATFIGQKIQGKISQERFLRFIYVLLVVIGIIMLVS